MKTKRYQELSPERKRLVRQMQRINFGRIERLEVKNGEPVSDPPTRIVQEVKFGGDNQSRAEIEESDFPLKSQVLDLLQRIDEIRDGQIDLVEIKHGLPFRMLVEA